MLQRSSRRLLPALRYQPSLLRSYSTVTDNPVPANNPNPKVSENAFQVSSTNALPSSSTGAQDSPLVELPEEGEEKRVMQAPNQAGIWSRSQQPRAKAMVGPRFEQTIMEDQVRLLRNPHRVMAD
jgi:NADH dehydrogenase (ubiquinone) Fe-S protein 6